MSLEGVTKDIKDERQLTGKRDTVVLNGWRTIWGVKIPGAPEPVLYIPLRRSRHLVHKVALLHKQPKSKKGDNSVNYLQNFAKS